MNRSKAVLKAISAILLLVALLVGIPFALVSFVGWPLPRTVPDVGVVWDSVAVGNIATQVIINALACVVWIAWLQVAWSVVVETVAVMRGRTARPVRGVASPIQLGVGRLVATAAILFALLPRGATVSLAPTVALSNAVPIVAMAAPPAHVSLYANPMPSVISNAPIADVSAPPTWTVQRGDSLWDIADRSLGSHDRWHEIFELNRGVVQADGRALTDPGVLEKGWVLDLPADSTVDATSPVGPVPVTAQVTAEPLAPVSYVVQPGDSLWGIA